MVQAPSRPPGSAELDGQDLRDFELGFVLAGGVALLGTGRRGHDTGTVILSGGKIGVVLERPVD